MALGTDTRNITVQAFPTNQGTFIGTATNQHCADKVVHVAEDGDLTLHFDAGDIVYTEITAPFDTQAASNCTGATSTATVYIS